MRIWIVNPYGTLPSEGWREYRSAQLARALADRGHEVTWWIADFEHRSKTYREHVTSDPQLPSSVAIRCVPVPSYRRHIGLGRIRFEQVFGRGVVDQAGALPPPDTIILAEPSLFYGVPVRKFAASNHIPLVIDILDLWPELFHIILPKPVRGLGELIFAPLYRRRRTMARQATAIAAVTHDYAEKVAASAPGKPTGVFYCGLDTALLRETAEPLPQLADWQTGFDGMTVAYAGTLGEAYDITTACEAVRLVAATDAPVRFVFAGEGTSRPAVEALARDFPDRVRFLGSIPPSHLVPLYRQSDVGLCSYAPGSTVSMPLKIFDYLAAGLAVLNSLDGEIRQIVASGCGMQYEPGSAQKLAKAIVDMAYDRPMLDAMKRHSASLGEQFDSRRQYGAFAEFIENVVEAR